MPLEKAAPGTPGFSRNVATEMRAGKPQKQAVAIAYREARSDADRGETITLRVDDEDGQLLKMLEHIQRASAVGHSFQIVVDPGDRDYEKSFGIDGDGAFRIYSIDAPTRADAQTIPAKLDACVAAADRASRRG